MADGNLSRIIVWVSDTVILKKQLDGKVYYYVADAVTGKPVAKANLEFFGWQQVQVKPNANQCRVETTQLHRRPPTPTARSSSARRKLPQNYQWLITARKAKDGPGRGRPLRLPGLHRRLVQPHLRSRVQPDQGVHHHRSARSIGPSRRCSSRSGSATPSTTSPTPPTSPTRRSTSASTTPRAKRSSRRPDQPTPTAAWPASSPLPKGATLGVYTHLRSATTGRRQLPRRGVQEAGVRGEGRGPQGAGRLGEQDRGDHPGQVLLRRPGDAAPRSSTRCCAPATRSDWYPRGAWDWFYGRATGGSPPITPWYPGWQRVGLRRPVAAGGAAGQRRRRRSCWKTRSTIGPDGTVKVVIDTAAGQGAARRPGPPVTITAEVVDESRRTIVGTGNVLVARKPFKVFAWVDRGYYRVGDTVKASFRAQTLDQQAGRRARAN